MVVHKGCFKCENEGCGWKLDMRNYYSFDGKNYCKNHNPMTGFSNTKVKERGKFTTNVDLETAQRAPKLDTVKSNIISPRDNHRPDQSADMVTQNALNAPKKDTEKGVGTGGGRNAQNFY